MGSRWRHKSVGYIDESIELAGEGDLWKERNSKREKMKPREIVSNRKWLIEKLKKEHLQN